MRISLEGYPWGVEKQGRQETICSFYNPATNAVIYCSYLITTSEYYKEEEAKGGYDIQKIDFISLSHFELFK